MTSLEPAVKPPGMAYSRIKKTDAVLLRGLPWLAPFVALQAAGCHLFSSGTIDETCEDQPIGVFFDNDGDGWGGSRHPADACVAAAATVDNSDDCDDADGSVHPDAAELCNGIDDNCDGTIDEGACDPEDCGDGRDNDGDGLADCEDPDCLDICIEDCADNTDNDGDGQVDCDDDECFGQGTCGGPYTLTLTTTLDRLAWAWGPDIENDFGQPAAAVLSGDIKVEAVADGWDGASFGCSGSIEGFSMDMYDSLYGGLYYSSSGGLFDFTFQWQPSTANGAVAWQRTCVITELPSTSLGFLGGAYYVSRLSPTGSWYPQYVTDYLNIMDEDGLVAYYLYYPIQQVPVTWTGVYGP